MQQSWGSDFEKDCRFKKSATDGPRQTTEWCMGEGSSSEGGDGNKI